MKKGFTLSEVLITLTILGIVFAITIPVLNNANPDKDKIIYQKAIYSVEEAMKSIMDDSTFKLSKKYWADDNISESKFCESYASVLNTTGKVDCNSTSSYANPNFITTDGIRFWGLEGKVYSLSSGNVVKTRTIYIDRQLNTKEKNMLARKRDSHHTEPGLKLQIVYNGKIRIPETEEWEYEEKLTEKF